MSPRIRLLSGAGRYADPFHPFAETSAALAELLGDHGAQVEIRTDVDAALVDLSEVDLLVVNTGDPWRNGETGFGAPADSVAGLTAAVDRGISILGTHTAVATLRDYPVWAGLLGALWLPGITMHPPLDDCVLDVEADHPLAAGKDRLATTDERYSFLQQTQPLDVWVHHDHEGIRHPVLWRREVGATRVVGDTLGHDARGYAAEDHRALLGRAVEWLLDRPVGDPSARR